MNNICICCASTRVCLNRRSHRKRAGSKIAGLLILTVFALSQAAHTHGQRAWRQVAPSTVQYILATCAKNSSRTFKTIVVRGFYVRYRKISSGPSVYGALLKGPTTARRVGAPDFVPSTLQNGVEVSQAQIVPHRLPPIQSYSWVNIMGKVTCYPGGSLLIVHSYRYLRHKQ
jgi:hypothetical protein